MGVYAYASYSGGIEMTYNVEQDYGKEAVDRTQAEFNAEWLTNHLKYALEDKKIIERFIGIASEHLRVVNQTQFKIEVSIDKEKNYATGLINYRVNVYRVPLVLNGDKMKVWDFYGEGKIFPRGDWPTKGEALQYAIDLSEKYGGCAIVGKAAPEIVAFRAKTKKASEVIEIPGKEPCETCGGEGVIRFNMDKSGDAPDPVETEPCPACGPEDDDFTPDPDTAEIDHNDPIYQR